MLLRRFLPTIMMITLGTVPRVGVSGCLALPDADYRAIDEEVDRNPERAIELASQQLRRLTPSASPLRRAELFAIISDAQEVTGLTEATLAERDSMLAELAKLPPSAATERIRLRVLLASTKGHLLSARQRAAVAELNAALSPVPADPLHHSCLLIAKATDEWQLGQIESAATDAIAARQIAQANGLPYAEMQAAAALAVIYRWSGLTAYSLPLIDEVAAFARDRHLTYLLSDTEYSRGRSLTLAGDFTGAETAFASLRQLLTTQPNRRMQAWLQSAECELAVARKDWQAAETLCRIAMDASASTGQQEALAIVQSLSAQIALEQKDSRAAIQLIDAALSLGFASPRPGFESQAYALRSRAALALGNTTQALADLRRSVAMAEQEGLGNQNRAVAVLTASVAAERALAEKRVLDERTRVQAQELAYRRRAQWLTAGLALGAATTAGLLAALVALQRRNVRQLALRDATLVAASSNAPDSLMLLTADRQVRFANRGFVGPAYPPAIGRPLAESLPAALRAPVGEAVDTLYSSKASVTFEANLVDSAGENRHFEFRGVPILDADRVVGATLRATDVTEARDLERDVVASSTRERALLSRELHEGLAQQLAGISMLVGGLPSAIKNGPELATCTAADIGSHVTDALKSVRALAERLSPLQTQRGSLTSALEAFCDHAQKRYGLPIVLTSDTREMHVSELTADHLYRIVEDGDGWLRFLGQISSSAKWICQSCC